MDREFDEHLYGSRDKFEGYNRSIPVGDNDDEEERHSQTHQRHIAKKMSSYTAPRHLMAELLVEGDEEDHDIRFRKPGRIIDGENDYRKRRFNRKLSPPRHDPFAAGAESPGAAVSTFADVMRREALKRIERETLRLISQKLEEVPGGVNYKKRSKAPKRILDDCSEPADFRRNVKPTSGKNHRSNHLSEAKHP